jgi:uncharacterized protein YggE
VLLTFLTFIFTNTSLPNNRHISVAGDAQILEMPDIAVIYFNMESERKTSLDTKKDVDERVNNLLDGLPDFCVDEENVPDQLLNDYFKS